MDKSGNSYYGREKLFMYNPQGKVFNEVITYEGVLHNISIDFGGNIFGVTSGKMPSYTVLYNDKGAPFYLLSNDFRNRVYFAPNQELVAVAGFGSLNGEIEIWDYKKLECIGKTTSSRSSFLKWSNSSRLFLTSVISEKLKVDHRICIYQFDGVQVKKINLDVFDLINVDFAVVCDSAKDLKATVSKKKAEGGGLLSTNKRLPGKIDLAEIDQTNKGTFKPVHEEKPKASLQVGDGSSGRFFNSKKKEDKALKFKKGG